MRTCYLWLSAILICACQEVRQTAPDVKHPSWKPIKRITDASLRGLHVVGPHAAWASGSKGTVLRYASGEWSDVSISDAAHLDFRDVHGFSAQEALVLSAGNGVSIYRTEDGGRHWSLVYADKNPDLFFDGFDFDKHGFGVAFGDPLGRKMALLTTQDHGRTWHQVADSLRPVLMLGEAGYAASGTGIRVDHGKVWIATGGGPTTRIIQMPISLNSYEAYDTPVQSAEGMGIFSLCVLNDSHLVVVGGSYLDSTNAESNVAVSLTGGATWQPVHDVPNGYRSCVAWCPDQHALITVGRTGSDISYDGGRHWTPIGHDGYFTCGFSGDQGWAVGRNGKIATLHWP